MYNDKFESLKLEKTELKPTCHYVSAACGSGKTYAVCSLIADRWINTTNVMIVCPTIKLIDEIDDRLSDVNINALKITSDQENNVRRRIIEETKNVPDNEKVPLITWNAYADLPYFHKRENWKILIDETPQLDRFYNWDLPRNSDKLLKHLKVADSEYSGLLRVYPTNRGKTTKWLAQDEDSIDEVFRRFFTQLTSSNYDIFVDKKTWNDQDSHTYSFISLLNKLLFIDTTLMGANLEQSLVFDHLGRGDKLVWKKHNEIYSLLRPLDNDLKDRAKIYYFLEHRTISKTIKQKKRFDEKTIQGIMNSYAEKTFNGDKFLFVKNNDDKTVLDGATSIPVQCRGSNEYSDYNGIYISVALNRSPKHSELLKLVGLTKEKLLTTTAHETYYQAVMRTSLRDKDNTNEVRIAVPDKFAAEYLGKLLGGVKSSRMKCPELEIIDSISNKERKRNHRFK
jgi:hypothetical protein